MGERHRILGWFLIALAIFPVLDRAIDALYALHTPNETVVRGRGTREELDDHPEIEVLVVGDSSARHGVDAEVLTRTLGRPAWNVGTWHGALAGQAIMIDGELRRGRKLAAVILMTTENGMALPIGGDAEEVILSYYLTPHAIETWYRLGHLPPDRVADWTLALLSPSYRDGKGLESLALDVLDGRYSWSQLAEQRAKNTAQREAYAETRGQGRLPDRTVAPDRSFFQAFFSILLDSRTYRWRPHRDVQHWYDLMAAACDRHGVLLIHFPTPRMNDILRHPNWNRNIGLPMRAWSAEMSRRHPSFRMPLPDPIAADPIEYADTADHLGRTGAARVSAIIGSAVKPLLEGTTSTTTPRLFQIR